MGAAAEVQFSGHTSNGQEARTRKVFGKDLNTGILLQYSDALKICQAFVPAVINGTQSNVVSKVLPAIPPQSGAQSITVDQKVKLLVKQPSEPKWQDINERSQDKSKKCRNRQLHENPTHRELVETNTRIRYFDGHKRIRNPSKYEPDY